MLDVDKDLWSFLESQKIHSNNGSAHNPQFFFFCFCPDVSLHHSGQNGPKFKFFFLVKTEISMNFQCGEKSRFEKPLVSCRIRRKGMGRV